ncbi:glycoside hydrolase family 3 C-terminal domain-containing protein [Halosquirtibacter xylanolyticus]|uniref:beta-glucosidase family protein n=1 Tax=Halosquirtibacter xylanolyticus TaxID=3374599 RepID=UPI003747B881|nr:glycoside hydrolase family 3 C-terminal domain-containing protein [Prolixibacteraceae bacterium]
MRSYLLVLICFMLSSLGFAQTDVNSKVESLLLRMTIEEKIDLIGGYKGFNTRGVPRLNVPTMRFTDGPMGVKDKKKKFTAYPATICAAATWNRDLVFQMGQSIASDVKTIDKDVLLAPGVNLYRVPQCGRNFEYMGEDPYLTSQMAVAYIRGVQDMGVVATVKHFVANNQDYDRHRVSSEVDERALHEIYFPPFKAAVQEAAVGAIMTSYNPLNGVHTSESHYLIEDVLREKWGFKGVVMSDWVSVYSTDAFKAGLDLEMPRPQYLNVESVKPIVLSSPDSMKLLDDKVRRILTFTLNHQKDKYSKQGVDLASREECAKSVAEEGIVLLKNKRSLLPIEGVGMKRILVVGPNAKQSMYSGGGAAKVKAAKPLSFYDSMVASAPNNYEIDLLELPKNDAYTNDGLSDDFVSKLYAVPGYDVVVAFVGFTSNIEGEGHDRPFGLPMFQNDLIGALAQRNRNTVVVINAGGGVAMPWVDKVGAIVHSWYPGQEGGRALANILYGKVNPSGKLPITIEKRWEDNAASASYDINHAKLDSKPLYSIHGKPHKMGKEFYKEGVFTGYRHFDHVKKKPLFAFGSGLSYTKFKLGSVSMDRNIVSDMETVKLTLTVKNCGDRSGSETVQLYVHDMKPKVVRPMKELKLFQKVFLEAGASKEVTFHVKRDMFAFYDVERHDWAVHAGKYQLLIGDASDNIVIRKKVEVR